MDKSFLVKLIGFPATLIHGDTLVLDRWLWLKKRLPITRNGEKLLDIGCGTGAFTIGSALRGYDSLGLSWDERNQKVAAIRAGLCKARLSRFDILDVRKLDSRKDLYENFDVAICLENIEHVIDDKKLLSDIALCIKPGGRLLLTTPFFLYKPITKSDAGPFSTSEDGWHVRKGYTEEMLKELCGCADLIPEHITFCSGFVSQMLTLFMRKIENIHPLLGWVIVLPLRILPPVIDGVLTRLLGWPHYSICLEAYKPRYKAKIE